MPFIIIYFHLLITDFFPFLHAPDFSEVGIKGKKLRQQLKPRSATFALWKITCGTGSESQYGIIQHMVSYKQTNKKFIVDGYNTEIVRINF